MSQYNPYNHWESYEDYENNIGNYQRFPINSAQFFNPASKRFSTRFIVNRRSGEFTGGVYGVYTVDEVRKVFLESASEYEAAMCLVSDWKHWQQLKACRKHKQFFEELALEKELQDLAKTKKLLWKAAENGNVSAQKILLDGFKKDKEAIKKLEESHLQVKKEKETEADYVRSIKESLRLVS